MLTVIRAAEAEKKFGQSSLKIYTTTFVPLYHAVTQRKVKTHMKMICLLPTEKVCIVIYCHRFTIVQIRPAYMFSIRSLVTVHCVRITVNAVSDPTICVSTQWSIITIIKTTDEFRNVSVMLPSAGMHMPWVTYLALLLQLSNHIYAAVALSQSKVHDADWPSLSAAFAVPIHMQRTVRCSELKREGGRGQRVHSAISP